MIIDTVHGSHDNLLLTELDRLPRDEARRTMAEIKQLVARNHEMAEARIRGAAVAPVYRRSLPDQALIESERLLEIGDATWLAWTAWHASMLLGATTALLEWN